MFVFMKKKKLVTNLIIAVALILLAIGSLNFSSSASTKTSTKKYPYGVFIGADSDAISKMKSYEIVVIDAQYFTKKEIRQLKDSGCTVYSYINVGSIEDFRPYYEDYKHLSLGAYENWEEESWIDVSDKSWQKFITDKLAKELVAKGIDGFFVDNTDVYYCYKTQKIYEGLTTILKGLKKTGKYVCINGGDTYITEFITKNGSADDVADAVNQESVFSEIDWDNDSFTKKSAEDSKYFKEYVELAAGKGLDIYLLEYTTDNKLIGQIKKYCSDNDFKYYISDSLELK